jgi:hypothetical protein
MKILFGLIGAGLLAGCGSTSMMSSVSTVGTAPDWVKTEQPYGQYGLAVTRFTLAITAPPASELVAGTTASWCNDIRDSYNLNLRKVLDVQIAYGRLAPRLRSMGDTLTAVEQTQAKAAILEYLTVYVDGATAYESALAALSVIGERCPQPLAVQVTEAIERSNLATYTLYGRAHPFSSDTITTLSDGQGFFTSISAKGEDQSVVALQNAIKSIVAVTTNFAPPDGTRGPGLSGADIYASRASQEADAIRRQINNPRQITRERLDDILDRIEPDPSQVPVPIEVSLPIRRTFLVEDMGNGVSQGINLTLPEELGIHVTGECSRAVSPTESTSFSPGTPAPHFDGVLISSSRACQIKVIRRIGGVDVPLADANTWAADPTTTIALPLDRTALVTRSTAYGFSNGRLNKVDVSSPAPAPQALLLPFTAIGAASGAVVQGFKDDTAEIEARTAQIEAETARLAALAALEQARSDAADAAEEEAATGSPSP